MTDRAPSAEPGESGAQQMTPSQRLSEDMKASMKARERVRLAALRLLATSVKNREVELGHALSEPEFMEVVTREVKRRTEAALAYERAGRRDRAETEREEQRALERYLPQRLGEEEVEDLIREAIHSTGASGPRDVGSVMRYVMGKAKGRVDGRAVQERALKALGG